MTRWPASGALGPSMDPVDTNGSDTPQMDVPVCHLTQDDLAARWRISPRSLERWRLEGRGPVWLRLPGRVVYRLEDVRAYERAHLRTP